MVSLDERIEQLEKYIVNGASVNNIDTLLKIIKNDIDASTIQDKENYQRLVKIIDLLFTASIVNWRKEKDKKKDGDLYYINKS